MSEPKACERCEFWTVTDGNPDLGQCRFAPPEPLFPAIPVDGNQLRVDPKWVFAMSVWPVTRKIDWCGAYAKTDRPEKSAILN